MPWILARQRQCAGLAGHAAEARALLRRELQPARGSRSLAASGSSLDIAALARRPHRSGRVRLIGVARPLAAGRLGIGDPGSAQTLDLGPIEMVVRRGSPIEIGGRWNAEQRRIDSPVLLRPDSPIATIAADPRAAARGIENGCGGDGPTAAAIRSRPSEAALVAKAAELLEADFRHGRLSLESLCRVNEIVLAGTSMPVGGRLRSGPAFVRLGERVTFIPPPAAAARAGAADFTARLADYLRAGEYAIPAAALAADSVARFTDLHPFADGNGRVSRAIAAWLLLRSGYQEKPDTCLGDFFHRFEREHYVALQHHEADPWSWQQFFFDAVLACYSPPATPGPQVTQAADERPYTS